MRLFPKRRWLRFSVRTLLIAVTIFCVWLGWQVSIVRERKALKQWVDTYAHIVAEAPPPWHRRLIGDKGVVVILLPKNTTESQLQEVRRVFPEAMVTALDKDSRGGRKLMEAARLLKK